MKGQPVLPIEPDVDPDLLIARTTGVIEWMCPACSRLDRSRPTINGRLQCAHVTCRRVWLVGFALLKESLVLPPHNARVDEEPKIRKFLNYPSQRVEDLPSSMGVARLAGPLEWKCRLCAAWNYAYPTWTTGDLACHACHVHRQVVVVLRAPANYRITAPKDWISYVAQTVSPGSRLSAYRGRPGGPDRAGLSARGTQLGSAVRGDEGGNDEERSVASTNLDPQRSATLLVRADMEAHLLRHGSGGGSADDGHGRTAGEPGAWTGFPRTRPAGPVGPEDEGTGGL